MKAFFKWISDHKTRVFGYFTAVIGAFSDQILLLKEVIDPHTFKYVLVIVGLVTATLGHLNAAKPQSAKAPPAE